MSIDFFMSAGIVVLSLAAFGGLAAALGKPRLEKVAGRIQNRTSSLFSMARESNMVYRLLVWGGAWPLIILFAKLLCGYPWVSLVKIWLVGMAVSSIVFMALNHELILSKMIFRSCMFPLAVAWSLPLIVVVVASIRAIIFSADFVLERVKRVNSIGAVVVLGLIPLAIGSCLVVLGLLS